MPENRVQGASLVRKFGSEYDDGEDGIDGDAHHIVAMQIITMMPHPFVCDELAQRPMESLFIRHHPEMTTPPHGF